MGKILLVSLLMGVVVLSMFPWKVFATAVRSTVTITGPALTPSGGGGGGGGGGGAFVAPPAGVVPAPVNNNLNNAPAARFNMLSVPVLAGDSNENREISGETKNTSRVVRSVPQAAFENSEAMARLVDQPVAMVQARITETAAIVASHAPLLAASVAQSVTTAVAAAGLRNSTVASRAGKALFFDNFMRVVGEPTLQKTQQNSQKQEAFIQTITTLALGSPVVRQDIQQQLPEVSRAFFVAEKQVVQTPGMLRFIGFPKTPAQWHFVHLVSQQVPIPPQNSVSLKQATQYYEKVFHVNLTSLAKSNNVKDQKALQDAEQRIAAFVSANLPIPKK